MKSPLHAALAVGSAILAACSSTPPRLDSLPVVTMMESRTAPADQDLTVTVPIPRTGLDAQRLKEGVTLKKDFGVPAAARVVISVPVEEQSRESRMQDGVGPEAGVSHGLDFRTTGYFSMAEQQIEKSLLEKGFQVQDRSKFEAKLREQRSQPAGPGGENPAKLAEVQVVEEKKNAGEVTVDQWAEELKRIEKKYASGAADAPGRRGKQELVDISELIRAAQDGEVQADFVLQVNTFQTQQLSDRIVELVTRPEVSALCLAHAGLRDALSGSGNAIVNQPGFFGMLNAKLIEVQTGFIVWVGEHRVDSERATELRILLPITKRVSNSEAINRAIRTYNDRLLRAQDACVSAQRDYDEAVQKGEATEQIQRRADEHARARNTLVKLMEAGAGEEAKAPWSYSYIFGRLLTLPQVPTEDVKAELLNEYANAKSNEDRRIAEQKIIRAREFLTNHYSELAKLVSRELISTLPAN